MPDTERRLFSVVDHGGGRGSKFPLSPGTSPHSVTSSYLTTHIFLGSLGLNILTPPFFHVFINNTALLFPLLSQLLYLVHEFGTLDKERQNRERKQ